MKAWWRLASERAVVKRACGYAVCVGALLVAINHGDAILRGDMSMARVLQMVLTVLVPYGVSTLSSVSALRQRCSVTQDRSLCDRRKQ